MKRGLLDAVIAALGFLAGYLPIFRKVHLAAVADLQAEKDEALDEFLRARRFAYEREQLAEIIIERHVHRDVEETAGRWLIVRLEVDPAVLAAEAGLPEGLTGEQVAQYVARAIGKTTGEKVTEILLRSRQTGPQPPE